jgi:serine protease Do
VRFEHGRGLRRVARGAVLLLVATGLAGGARASDPFLRHTATVTVVEKVGPAVVNITTERVVTRGSPFNPLFQDPTFDQFFRDFFEPRRQTLQSLGSGVIIDRDRHVLTNEHVVSRASRIRVSLADGREFDASVVGADPNNDLAVLQIESKEKLPWVAPGTSSDLMVGEPVIAIGNPFGLSNTVTTGVISAVDRSMRTDQRTFHGFLQTDASINPGNSGGPLLNAEGKLIAINTAIYNGAQGIGFAIPIDVAKRVVTELIAHGEVQPVWLGLEFQDLDPSLRDVMSLPEGVGGALVNRVRSGSPAGRAGLQRGDIVTALDGRAIAGARSFFEMLSSVTVGQELKIQVWRDSGLRDFSVAAEEVPDSLIPALADELLGVSLAARSGSDGFAVTKVRSGSASDRIGIRPGDLLLGVNGMPLRGADDLRRAMLNLRGRSRALVVVQRGAGRYHVAIPLV